MEAKKKTNTTSSLRYLILCSSTVLVITICVYTWSLYDRLSKRQQTNTSSVWSLSSLPWMSKDTNNLKSVLELVKEDLHTICFVLRSAVCLLIPRETTSIISAVFLTLAIVTFFYTKPIAKEDIDIENDFINIKEETNVLNSTRTKVTNVTRTSNRYPTTLYSLLSFKKIFFLIIFVMFLISIPIEYVRLFQMEAAKRMTVMGKGVPSECYPEQMTITESVRYWMVSQLSWQHDPCEKYHTAILVDPLWEITPLMVLSSVITRSLLHPIELFFGGIGKSFRLFFNEIPAQWQPIMLIVIVVVSLLSIVMLCGYRISLPLILKIEPKTPQSCKTKSHTGRDSIDGYTKTNNFDIKDRKQIEYSQEKS
ncbi:uncharacterized protein [Mytilus edulis]|uniref:uncharacterized protein isoform X3 n=1 Tax=Mytilus edulis TaxID=6550 RepID=UPI0039F142F2